MVEQSFEHVAFSGVQTPPLRARRRPFWRRHAESPSSACSEQSAATPEQRRFLRLLLERAHLDLENYHVRPLVRRLPACLRVLRVRNLQEAQQRLAEHPELHAAALNTVLIGVTRFFRDEEVFAALRHEVLPALLADTDRLRVWSAGCSNGAELYSMALLLAERGALGKSHLLGTDCRSEAIYAATAGVCNIDLPKDLSPETIEHVFMPTREGWRVRPEHAGRIEFALGNVLAGAGAGAFDLVLCRNLAIYLTSEALEQIWRRLVAALRPGGVLVLGRAEKPDRHLPLTRLGPCIYCRQEERA